MRRDADYAETEWETIRARTQGGLQEKEELTPAAHIGGRAPYGYRIANKGTPGSYLVIDEDEAKVIKHVYDLVVGEGLNLRKATVRLVSEGITARSGKTWTRDNLRDRIMSTPVLDTALVFRGKHAKRKSRSSDAIEAATTVLNEELQQLLNLRDEAADWLAEMEESDQYARDLITLASMAKNSFPNMAPEQQAAISSMLELKITVTGPVPDDRRGGVPCTVRAWYATAGLTVPAAALSDEEWEGLLPYSLRGAGGRSGVP
jgi:hypothetical protein